MYVCAPSEKWPMFAFLYAMALDSSNWRRLYWRTYNLVNLGKGGKHGGNREAPLKGPHCLHAKGSSPRMYTKITHLHHVHTLMRIHEVNIQKKDRPETLCRHWAIWTKNVTYFDHRLDAEGSHSRKITSGVLAREGRPTYSAKPSISHLNHLKLRANFVMPIIHKTSMVLTDEHKPSKAMLMENNMPEAPGESLSKTATLHWDSSILIKLCIITIMDAECRAVPCDPRISWSLALSFLDGILSELIFNGAICPRCQYMEIVTPHIPGISCQLTFVYGHLCTVDVTSLWYCF